MTDERRQQWADYLKHLANRMGLRDWEVVILAEECDIANFATFEGVYGRKVAKIRLCPDWEDYTPEVLRHTLVHELVHAHFHMAEMYARNAVKPYTSEREAASFSDAFEHLWEYGIDGMADVLAPFMPLPGKVVPALARKPKT